MATTIRINEDVKQQLKHKSVLTGVSQYNLANKYILEGIKNDSTPNKPLKSIEEIEKILDNDRKDEMTSYDIDLSDDIPDELKLNDDDNLNIPVSDMNDVKNLLDFDNDSNDDVLKNLDGAVVFDKETNSLKLKKEAYK
ncbi:hypothetical protein PXD04_07920 [Methanosphaera sp. ISO3-F5]|uniref:hypothetical protein n=1 Tax=Methanosphaera sp. ISO3-F5 TaxID=1452353 RepID=UPI002B25A73D|nr:hypothetical protein [Methanosphaera sp. ISO3-F5]WQH63621.1 hypothetical protein PXD04_07920 [Methanosphaera sp. ISO3-F5]